MAKSLATTPKSFDDINDVLRVPEKRARLQGFIDEAIRHKSQIHDHTSAIKDIREDAVANLNVSPKMFNTLVSVFFNNDFEQRHKEVQQLECALETLMQVDSQDE